MSNDTLISRILRDSTWSMIATFTNKISLVIVGVIISRGLGVEVFGKFAIIQSVVIMLANVVAQSITTSTSKHLAEYQFSEKIKAGRGVAVTLLFSILFSIIIIAFSYFYSNWFAKYLLLHEELNGYVFITVTMIVLNVVLGWVQGVFSGLGKFKVNAIINLLISILSIGSAVVMTKWYGFNGAIYSYIFIQAVAVSVSFYFINKSLKQTSLKIQFSGCFNEVHVVTHIGLPVMFTGIIVAPVTWFSNRLLSELNDGLQQLAVFSASMQWSAIFTQASIVLGTVLIPLLSSEKSKNNNQLEKINFYSSWLFTVSCSVPLLIFSDVFVKIYGRVQDINNFSMCVSFVLFSAILTAFKSGIARKIIVLNLSWYSVVSNIAWAAIFIIFSLNAKKYGAMGITGSLFLSQLLHFIITTPYFMKRKIIEHGLILNPKVFLIILVPVAALLVRFYVSNDFFRISLVPILLLAVASLSFKLFRKDL